MEVAADASLIRSLSYRIYENGKALKDLTENWGVILHDTPEDYFPAYMNAARASLEKNAEENAFFQTGLGLPKSIRRNSRSLLGGGADFQRQTWQGVCGRAIIKSFVPNKSALRQRTLISLPVPGVTAVIQPIHWHSDAVQIERHPG